MGDEGGGRRGRGGVKIGVVDAVAVYFADVEIGHYGFDVWVGDMVGGAPDAGGGFGGVILFSW